MTFLYSVLFDLLAFPVFFTDTKEIVIYKNKQSKKYQKHIRLRAQIAEWIEHQDSDDCITISGHTPYRKSLRLHCEDGYLYLFLTRFQYPDGNRILKQMAEAFNNLYDSVSSFFRKLWTRI